MPRPRNNRSGEKEVAKVLAVLGVSGVFASLAELADACRSGSLIMTSENYEVLKKAQNDLSTIKTLLMKFLKLKET